MKKKFPYKRILLKLSGESFQGKGKYGISRQRLIEISKELRDIHELGIEVALVVGGGNIFRGQAGLLSGFSRVNGDTIGMLATIINSLALASTLEEVGLNPKILLAISMQQIADTYAPKRAIKSLEKGRIVILGGGSGNAFFTTDTAAALRALQIKADVLIKGTRVNGVYSDDPEKNTEAEFFDEMSYQDVLDRKIEVMDSTSFTLCEENNMPIVVFNFEKKDNLKKLLSGQSTGTLIHN
ncbi:MAG: UMP kinase [Candidatus Zixiibacteriota bacterium]